jgi:uncharacterized protein with FMN-binding domain
VKRAVFVTAGTVAGLVASFSYTPGLLPALLADGGGTANAAAKQTKDAKSGPASGTSPDKGGHKKADKKKAKAGGQDGGSGHGKATSTRSRAQSGGGAGGGGSTAGATGSTGTVSSGTSGGSTGTQSTPQPTRSDKPKPSPKPTPPAQPKTYAGNVVSTAFGPMQVSITVLDGRITDAQALQFPSADPKSVEIAKTALPKLRSETLSAQSGSIAVVSGATYTSKGWISSLQSALSKAGL